MDLMLRGARETATAAACLIRLHCGSNRAHSSVLCVPLRACFYL